VGPRAGLDVAENLAPTGFDNRTVQLVANCYTSYCIPAHNKKGKLEEWTYKGMEDRISFLFVPGFASIFMSTGSKENMFWSVL
jgi:hypothetical protein